MRTAEVRKLVSGEVSVQSYNSETKGLRLFNLFYLIVLSISADRKNLEALISD